MGFWHNKNGQAVINNFNGGSTATNLGDWLAANFPNLFGSLAGDTNAQIAGAFSTAFGNVGGVQGNTYAQSFAVALAIYTTTTSLGGASTAGNPATSKFGFVINAAGLGAATYNVGNNGAAFGVPNNTSLTVMQILQIANANYNPSTGLFYGGDSTKTGDLNNVTNGINQSGDITQVADNSSTAADNLGGLLKSIYDLDTGTLSVYVDNSNGYVTPDEQARIDDAIASIDANLGAFGVNLVDITATDTTGGAAADIVIQIADTSALGGVAQGILGVYEFGGMITLVNGWNWYTGSDPTQIGAGQYDFQTTATHELGHALGLGGSDDTNSPMFESLPPGVTRRTLTASDLSVVENDAANPAPDPERAAPANGARGDVIEGRNLLVASPGLPLVQAGGSALESSSGSSLSISTAGSQDDVSASMGFTLTASFAPVKGSPASDTVALHDRAGDLLFSELGRTTALARQGLGGAVDNVTKNLNGEHISAHDEVQPVTPLVVVAPGRHDLGAIDQVTGTGNVPSRPLEAWIGAGVDGDWLFLAALVGVGTANLSSLVFEKDTDDRQDADPALSRGLKRKRFWE